MATSQRPTTTSSQPAGVEGDGMDPYPTYHDGSSPPRPTTGTKPTDVNLPRSRRTYALPILIGLVVFALIIIVRLGWEGMNLAGSTDEAMTPGDPATPPAAASAPASAAPTAAAPEGEIPLGEEDAQTTTGPGEVGAAPGSADVPGGATTDAPQQ